MEALCVGGDHATNMEIERAQITGNTGAIWLRCPACQHSVALFVPMEIYRVLEPTLNIRISETTCANIQGEA